MDYFRFVGGDGIGIPAQPRPTLENIQEKFGEIEATKIVADTSPTGIVCLRLGTVLSPRGSYINGKTYETRRAGLPVLGLQHALWLLENYGRPVVRGFIDGFREKEYFISFFGIEVRRSGKDGRDDRPYFSLLGERPSLRWTLVDNPLGPHGLIAVDANQIQFVIRSP